MRGTHSNFEIIIDFLLPLPPLPPNSTESSGRNSSLSCTNHTSSVVLQGLHLPNLQYKEMLLHQTCFNRALTYTMNINSFHHIFILSEAVFKSTSDSLIYVDEKKDLTKCQINQCKKSNFTVQDYGCSEKLHLFSSSKPVAPCARARQRAWQPDIAASLNPGNNKKKKLTEPNCIVAAISNVASLPKNMQKWVRGQRAFLSSDPASFRETLRLTVPSSHGPRPLVPSSGCTLWRPSEYTTSSIFTTSQFALCFCFNTIKSSRSFLVRLNLWILLHASSINRGDNTSQPWDGYIAPKRCAMQIWFGVNLVLPPQHLTPLPRGRAALLLLICSLFFHPFCWFPDISVLLVREKGPNGGWFSFEDTCRTPGSA